MVRNDDRTVSLSSRARYDIVACVAGKENWVFLIWTSYLNRQPRLVATISCAFEDRDLVMATDRCEIIGPDKELSLIDYASCEGRMHGSEDLVGNNPI